MGYELCQRWWFQWLERLWRPLLSWALAINLVAYAARAPFGRPLDLAVLAALAALAGIPFAQRGLEKVARARTEAKAAVEAVRAMPNGAAESALKPDVPAGEVA